MKTAKTQHALPIIIPKGSTGSTVETPDHLPSLHGVFNAVARRGMGKSFAVISLLKHYMDAGSIDRVFVISPTIHSNQALLDMIKIDPEDFYEEPNKESLDDVLRKVDEEARDYEEYIEQCKLYKRYLKFVKTGRMPLDDYDLLSIFDEETGSFAPPVHRWNGKKPGLALIIDDAQGSPIMMPKAQLMKFIIKHRHHGTFQHEEGALGISVFFCCQSFKAANGGLPRSVRGNCTGFLIWKVSDIKQLNEIAEEISGLIPKETFLKVYQTAVDKPHGFLYIDIVKKECHPSMFRSQFDTFLIPDEADMTVL